jgi:aminomethyltransferase
MLADMNTTAKATLNPAIAARTHSSMLRHVAPGGGHVSFTLNAGDRVTLTDPEGLQAGELYIAGPAGIAATLLQGVAVEAIATHDAPPCAQALMAGAPSGWRLARAMLFGADGLPGACHTFRAPGGMRCALAAPGGDMQPDAQDAPTELIADIECAAPVAGIAPPPLAPPVLDLRIDAGTARAYRVKAGDYIQVIDVDGRQCSDFLAFDAAALARGEEYDLDPTTTRTLMGSASPGPGLLNKYYDERQVALVEVIRDTVGRHDTFMLACSAKYYDDMGYPGHDNCTDNFNQALAPHGVARRAGWPAINFFYNTFVNHDDSISLDEPWSRAGDYVLLRALTDLVCASSSCTDDIDPANGWNPTDIHVRVYDGSNNFSRGIAHRMTPDAAPKLTRETGFHARTSALTRRMVEYRGFWLQDSFSSNGPIDEYWACRERAAMIDLSALRKFEITGPDAERLLQLATTRNIRKLAVGQIVYTALCYEHGGMIDDGTVFRLCQNNFRLVCGDEYCGVWLRELAARHALRVWVKSSTDQLHNLSVQGPKSRDILRDIVVTPPGNATMDELKWFRFTVGKIDGLPVLVSRTGYTGELGYEVWCHPKHAVQVWDAIAAAGEPHGIAPMGLAALDMLRIEAGLMFAEYDFCDQTDPFEAGIGFAVAADKEDDYVGKEALARRKAHPARVMVGLDIEGSELVAHGDPNFNGRAQIGQITSTTRSPILGKTIALARLDVSAVEPGATVEIGKLDGHQKRIRATQVRFSHYDPEKTRVRA